MSRWGGVRGCCLCLRAVRAGPPAGPGTEQADTRPDHADKALTRVTRAHVCDTHAG
jgi:hypothetical protein